MSALQFNKCDDSTTLLIYDTPTENNEQLWLKAGLKECSE